MNPPRPSGPADRTPAPVLRDDVPLASIAPAAWDALAPGEPLLSHAFLSSLHDSGCASTRTGWRPCFVTAWANGALAGALPLYAKMHSYGEYVFDWAWADAYRRHHRRYYPKLVAAIPFTPTAGPRLLAPHAATRRALLAHARGMLDAGVASSLHVLFAHEPDIALCAQAAMIVRHGVQFHWDNPGYRDFADFLSAFNHEKRKKVRQERRKLADAGVTFAWKTGRDIGGADWAFFHDCYVRTYEAHGSTPYLTRAFFETIGAAMPQNLLLVVGLRGGRPICAALDVFTADALWGRYWGATEYLPGLHFETCYYQAIEFCIERRIARFEGGAQGTHKLARGLLPVTTASAHAIADPDFAAAIADFCARERAHVAQAVDELETASPFRDRTLELGR